MTTHHKWCLLFVIVSATAFGTPPNKGRGSPLFRRLRAANAKNTLFASPLTRPPLHWNGGGNLHEPTSPLHKTPEKQPSPNETKSFIREALLDNALFSNLPEKTLQLLIEAFEPTTFRQNEVIVTQGDACSSEGDYLYLLGSGQCSVWVDGQLAPEPYGTLKPKAIIGELGVLYNQTRSATIIAKSPQGVALFRIRADMLKTLLNQQPTDDPELLHKIDQAIHQVAGTKSLYGGTIIRQYKPNRSWLWRQWQGTVLQHNYKIVIGNMLVAAGILVFTRCFKNPTWKLGLKPDTAHPWIQAMDILRKLWTYQMSLTTFILTFFVQQAYTFWKEIYGIARIIQGRLGDINMIVATNCQRNPDGSATPESEQLMDDIAAYTRLFHALFWASQTRRYAVLRTPKGLERMATRGLITSRQLKVLMSLDLPDNQLHNAPVEWMMIRANKALHEGVLAKDDPGAQLVVREKLMAQMGLLRGLYDGVGGKLVCRMPLPYTHLVQLLVDTFVLLSPVALYADLGAYSILCVGVLTLFYTGLLNLAKVFLDPLDNDDFTKHSIDMDVGVFIRESNAGSIRYKNAAAHLPFDL